MKGYMKNYYVTPRLLRRARAWSEVKTYLIGFLLMACAVLVLRSEVERMNGVKLRGNLAALCEVADRPPWFLWLDHE